MSFLDQGYLGSEEPGLGKNVLQKAAGAVTGAVQDAGRSIASAAQPVFRPLGRSALKIGQQVGTAVKTAALDTSKEVGKGLTQATLATGTALKQAGVATGTALKQTGIAVTDTFKAGIALVAAGVSKGGRVVDADGGPVALDQQPLASLGWTIYANPGVAGEPILANGDANPAWPGYYATRGSEMSIRGTFDAVVDDVLKRPSPALDATGSQATWEGWAFWMIPATPGDSSSADWPGFYAQKGSTKTGLGTADAVLKDVQAREVANAPDQELPPSETNPYLGWALWWRPSEGDAGLYGKKNGVETIHGTADAVATDIQNREKANQPQTPSGGIEKYSGQDYQGWQLWTSTSPLSVTGTAGTQQWFGVQGGARTALYADVSQLYADIQSRAPQQTPTVDPGYQPSPYQPSPYQPSPYMPSPALPAPYQPTPYTPPSASPAPMTGGGGSFASSGASFNPMASGGGYSEGGFLTPDDSSTVSASDEGMPSADGGEEGASADEATEEPSAFDEAEEFEFEESELDEGPPRSFSRGSAVDGLGAAPSLPSAILPLAGVALLWYLVTRK